MLIGSRNIYVGVGCTIASPSWKNFMSLDLDLRTKRGFFSQSEVI
jgi:hypothetical protein